MNNKLLLPIIFLIFLLPITFATPSVEINNIQYQDRTLNNILIANNTGDRLLADITVNPNNESIKRVYLAWGENSWVDCNKNSDNKYLCILTVTPYMSSLTDVFLIVGYGQNLILKNLIGNYDFHGELFPIYLAPERPIKPTTVTAEIKPTIQIVQLPKSTNNFCEKKQVCTSYQKTCEKICARLSANQKYCYQYKMICKPTDLCLRYTERIVCKR